MTESGNVGIGFTVPLYLLAIRSRAVADPPFQVQWPDGSNLFVISPNSGIGSLSLYNPSGTAKVSLAANAATASATSYIIDTMLGINTTVPTSTLQVQGTFNVSGPGRSGDLFVASSGKVGINTTTPAQTLTVQGTLNVTPQNATGTGLFVTSNGNVGIGTASPGGDSGIAYSPTPLFLQVGSRATGQTSKGVIRIAHRISDVGNNNHWDIGTGYGSLTGANDDLFIADPSAVRMVISSSGNVGIGVSVPATALQVAALSPELRLNSTSGGYIGLKVNNNGFNGEFDIFQNGTVCGLSPNLLDRGRSGD